MYICESTISGRETTSTKVSGWSDVMTKRTAGRPEDLEQKKKKSKNMAVDWVRQLKGPAGIWWVTGRNVSCL